MRFLSLFTMLLLVATGSARGETLYIAVAANFAAPAQEIARQFEQQTGHQLRLSFGASGSFYAQIVNGAPFQLFFSADQAKPAALEAAGLVVAGSRFTYALGTLVLWSRQAGEPSGRQRLESGQFNKLALANPRLAPYGAAAVEALENLGLRQGTESKWVQGENIAQTWQFAQTGNVDLALVALSQVIHRKEGDKGEIWVLPEQLYSPIKQDAVLLQKGEGSQAAHDFLVFVQSEQGRRIIQSYGYGRGLSP